MAGYVFPCQLSDDLCKATEMRVVRLGRHAVLMGVDDADVLEEGILPKEFFERPTSEAKELYVEP